MVIGNGNVAADVARMLALSREELAATDVADHALDVLAESKIREIVVLGRRGPAQAAFTTPELLELGEMTEADVFVDARDAEVDPLSRTWLESEEASATRRKNVDILSGYAAREPAGKHRRIVLRFLVSRWRSSAPSVWRASGSAATSCATGWLAAGLLYRATEELDCGIVFRSIGYGASPSRLPFDERGR